MGNRFALRPLRFSALLALIWVLALSLALLHLGNLPLRDWDEGLVARVALEASLRPLPHLLLPTYWGDPYLNKPPAVHLLIAAVIGLWRTVLQHPAETLPPEWVVRLGPAVVSASLPPLLALVQLRLRPGERGSALATALIALTLMPLVRHGRLAMLDGTLLVALVLLWWALLSLGRSGLRTLPLGLIAGLATSLLLLLKAPAALPLLLGSLALLRFERNGPTPRWLPLLLAIGLGLLPGVAWHLLHVHSRGTDALLMWGQQGYARVHTVLEGNRGGPGTVLLEVLKGGWPWLPLWPFGLALAWRQRGEQAGHWSLGLTLLTALLVLPLRTQLPWYSLLLWPPFCLLCGPVLAWLVSRSPSLRPPVAAVAAAIPSLWAALGGVLLVAYPLADVLALPLPVPLRHLPLLLGPCLLIGGLLLRLPDRRRRCSGALILGAGAGGTLALLLASPLWLWELNESWPVRPVASMATLPFKRDNREPLLLWREGERPSLSWYVGQRLRRIDTEQELTGISTAVLLVGRGQPVAADLRCEPLAGTATHQLLRCRRGAAPLPPAPDPPPSPPGSGGFR